MQTEEIIGQYIAKNLLFSEKFPYPNDASFLAEGVIDSIGVMELVAFVGQHFNIAIEPEEITPENFDSVERIARFVERKQVPQAA